MNNIRQIGDSQYTLSLSAPIEILSRIIKDINHCSWENEGDAVNDVMKSLIDSTKNNIFDMINNIIIAVSHQNELKNEIDNKIEAFENKIIQGLSRENKQLKTKNEELLNMIQNTSDTYKQCHKDLALLKTEQLLTLNQLKEQNEKITQLNSKIFSLTRKVNTNPALPYINFEKAMFNKLIDSHTCICHICGNEINTSGNSTIQPSCNNISCIAENKEVKVNMNDNNTINTNIEDLLLLSNENENLKTRIAELIEANEKMKIDSAVTENKILSSKAFKSLYSQAEVLFKEIDQLKETNHELQREKYDMAKDKEIEMKNEEKKFNEKRLELEKQILDFKKRNESNMQTINNLNVKIETLENLLKAKSSQEIESLFRNFDLEKEKWTNRLELIKEQKKEYSKKYEDEYSKNLSNERLIIKLNSEIEKLRQNLSKYENIEKEEKYEKFDIKERDKMKRDLRRQEDKINLYERNLKDLKTEIQMERDNGEKLISELEVNEKGLDELNKKLKTLMNQMLESNEKMAKMTNEKIKDMHTIKLLNEEKENLDNLIKEKEAIIQNYLEYTKKIEANQNTNKDLITKLEQELKLKEEEFESVKNETKQISKNSEQNRIAYEETLKALNDSQQISSRASANFEQMKAKYEELCKLKKLDSSLIGKSFEGIAKENEVLTLENKKYKVKNFCLNFFYLVHG